MSDSTSVRLRPPRHPVDPRAKTWWRLQALAFAGPPFVVLLVLGIVIAPARTWLLLGAAAFLLWGLVLVFVMPPWRYFVHRWETTEDAVYTAAGWFKQEWRVAPMSRIQTVDMVRGPLQQLFGLASVTVTTASAAGPITIEGLDRELAQEVVEKLTEVTQATPGDAT